MLRQIFFADDAAPDGARGFFRALVYKDAAPTGLGGRAPERAGGRAPETFPRVGVLSRFVPRPIPRSIIENTEFLVSFLEISGEAQRQVTHDDQDDVRMAFAQSLEVRNSQDITFHLRVCRHVCGPG